MAKRVLTVQINCGAADMEIIFIPRTIEKTDGNWFSFHGTGHMLTGWQIIDGNAFYFNSSGHLVKSA